MQKRCPTRFDDETDRPRGASRRDNREVPESREESLLAAAAELEARDERVAAELARIGGLSARTGSVGNRARELATFLKAVPVELAELEREEAAHRARLDLARADEEAAAQRLEELEGARRAADRRAQAERERERAREAGSDAMRGIERVQARRRDLLAEEQSSQAETRRLVIEAREVASALRHESRISAAGKDEPGESLAALTSWADRAGTALLAVRVGLDGERERIVREANELGGSVLGEALGGSSVSVVRRRLEHALRSSG
jgi:colicin import membrane protein